MRKNIVIVMTVLMMCFAFTACGGKDMSDSPYVGTWKATKAEYGGFEISVDSVFDKGFSFTLEDNGKCVVNANGEEEKGSWDESEKGFNVVDEFEFTADGNKAVLEYEGIKINFEKE